MISSLVGGQPSPQHPVAATPATHMGPTDANLRLLPVSPTINLFSNSSSGIGSSSQSSTFSSRRNLGGIAPLSLPQPAPLPDMSDARYVPPSELFPWLFMGSEEDAQNIEVLRRYKVRYIVNAARECANHHEKSNLVSDNDNSNKLNFIATGVCLQKLGGRRQD